MLLSRLAIRGSMRVPSAEHHEDQGCGQQVEHLERSVAAVRRDAEPTFEEIQECLLAFTVLSRTTDAREANSCGRAFSSSAGGIRLLGRRNRFELVDSTVCHQREKQVTVLDHVRTHVAPVFDQPIV